jgi:hypothetical protein
MKKVPVMPKIWIGTAAQAFLPVSNPQPRAGLDRGRAFIDPHELGIGISKGSKMKKAMHTIKAPTDDIYYVSAADVADKIIDHMRRGSDPLLFSSSPSAHISLGLMWRIRTRRDLD